jgi:uncharacterized protein (UPF0332 family)
MADNEIKDCFENAIKDEEKGKKHKGLLIGKVNEKMAKSYLAKAKLNIQLCELYKKNGFDYMIPEAWYYTLYYCALAILLKFGITSRNQRCTASFLRYAKDNKLIDYESEFIDRITVHRDKEEKSDVDKREEARYGPLIRIEDVPLQYDSMNSICKKAIEQCEEIVFSNKEFKVPKELYQ